MGSGVMARLPDSTSAIVLSTPNSGAMSRWLRLLRSIDRVKLLHGLKMSGENKRAEKTRYKRFSGQTFVLEV